MGITVFNYIVLFKWYFTLSIYYLALYNEVFINGQRNVGNGNTVEVFDRNRMYTGLGYILNDNFKVQLGIMNQATNGWKKNQLQVSLHHKF